MQLKSEDEILAFCHNLSSRTLVKVLKAVAKLQPVTKRSIAAQVNKDKRYISLVVNKMVAANILKRVQRMANSGAVTNVFVLADFTFEVVP